MKCNKCGKELEADEVNTHDSICAYAFNLADYEFIEVKFGWKAIFKGNETTSGRQVVHNYQNPGGTDINELTETNTKLDTDYDNCDTTGKSYDAQVGWLNIKWHDSQDKIQDNIDEYFEEYDDNVEWERENR